MAEPSTAKRVEVAARKPAIEARGIVRTFGDFVALDSVDLTVFEGEFFSLLGPSGCGKTTLLRIVAGLDLADRGEVAICGVESTAIPAHKRPVNTVFQSYALFPHLDVRDNIAFGLRMKKKPEAEVAAKVEQAIEMVQIGRFADRKPAQLSGGQKQRVALARALVNEPKVLLLDEPLGALDLKLRKELQVELLALQRRLGITFLFVTHDQEEALVMSDRIAVMRAGRIEQLDASEALYERPRNRFVAQFLGSCNLLEVEVEGATLVRSALGPLSVRSGGRPLPANGKATLAIRPEKVALAAAGGQSRENCVPARVEEVLYIGAESHYLLSTPLGRMTAYVMNSLQQGLQGLEIGDAVELFLPPSALVVLED